MQVRVWRGASREPRSALPGPSRGSGPETGCEPHPVGGAQSGAPSRPFCLALTPPATAWLAAGRGTRGDPPGGGSTRLLASDTLPLPPPPPPRLVLPAVGLGQNLRPKRMGAVAETRRAPRAERGCACGLRPRRGAGRRGGSSPGRAGGDRGGPWQAQPLSAQHPPTRCPVLHPLRTLILTGPPIPVSPAVFSTSLPQLHRIRPPPNFAHSVPRHSKPHLPHTVSRHGLLSREERTARQGSRASQTLSSTGPSRPPSRPGKGAPGPLFPPPGATAQVPPGPCRRPHHL
ncbi:unnamed protein product [Rangifer tarandus platyrhynchus]|uniref:Uncharacterized protein n=1 Tax=Rangifer tarandus platyrhynchus TaxID=3082113 RepID=A0AC60A4V0_RANTA